MIIIIIVDQMSLLQAVVFIEDAYKVSHLILQDLQISLLRIGVRCRSVVKVFAHGAMGCQIDPSWRTHWAISRSNQCSTTGVTKAVVCVILSVGWCI